MLAVSAQGGFLLCRFVAYVTTTNRWYEFNADDIQSVSVIKKLCRVRQRGEGKSLFESRCESHLLKHASSRKLRQ